ncbi:MAG: TonB-dependent hemoglobin/transferrin/lactoferrin family receptor [Pseudomonadota bacterium]
MGSASWGRSTFLAATSVLAIGVSAAAVAQPAETTASDEDVITVYGTSNPIPAFDYPGQVTVVDKDEIDERIASSVSDALRDVPGIDFAGGPRRTGQAPSIRGLSGENILILLDGARQSFISAHDGRFFVDPDLIGRAEVVRGPASALYGSGAVGGVLALETVDAADLLGDGENWGVRTRLGHQSVNEEQLGSITAFSRIDKLDVLASIGTRSSGDITLGSGADLPSEDEINTGLLKASYQLTDAVKLEGSWQRFKNRAVEPNNGQGTAGTGDSILDREVKKDIESETFRAAVTFDPSSDLINTSVTAYRTTNAVNEFDNTVPRTTLREITTDGISLRNASLFTVAGSELTFTIGGDWYKDEQTGIDSETLDGARGGVPNGESEFLGVFAQLEASFEQPFGLPGELLIIPGIRYDEFESSSSIDPAKNEDDAVSPRFAVSYGPNEWFRVFGSYSEGFRAPSINELYLDGLHFQVPHPILFDPTGFPPSFVFVNNNFVPNPDLVPEKTETLEFGIGVDFQDLWTDGDRLQGKISAYQSDVEDLINLSVNFAFDPTCFSPPFFPCTAGTSDSANLDSAELEGIEAEFTYDNDLIFAVATYTTVDGEDTETGSDIGSLTPDRLALNAGVKLMENSLRLGTRLQYAAEFDRRTANMSGGFDIVEERDSYTVVDLYATWRPAIVGNLSIKVGVDNVHDENYERVFEGVSQPGRNYKVAASWQFGG